MQCAPLQWWHSLGLPFPGSSFHALWWYAGHNFSCEHRKRCRCHSCKVWCSRVQLWRALTACTCSWMSCHNGSIFDATQVYELACVWLSSVCSSILHHKFCTLAFAYNPHFHARFSCGPCIHPLGHSKYDHQFNALYLFCFSSVLKIAYNLTTLCQKGKSSMEREYFILLMCLAKDTLCDGSSSLILTTLQSMINAKLSKQRFWHCHENGLIKTIQTIPHNL